MKKTKLLTPKNLIANFLIAAILVIGLKIIPIQTTKADFLVEDDKTAVGNIIITENNTLLSKPNPVKTLRVVKRIKMIITAYSSTPEETNGEPFITASGKMVAEGIVANNALPFGTKIRIPELYGDKIFVVEDRMHPRKGNYHLDIWFADTQEAKNFGAEIAYVEILEN